MKCVTSYFHSVDIPCMKRIYLSLACQINADGRIRNLYIYIYLNIIKSKFSKRVSERNNFEIISEKIMNYERLQIKFMLVIKSSDD